MATRRPNTGKFCVIAVSATLTCIKFFKVFAASVGPVCADPTPMQGRWLWLMAEFAVLRLLQQL